MEDNPINESDYTTFPNYTTMPMGTVQFQAGEEHVRIAFAFGITVACIAQVCSSRNGH